MFSRRPVFKVGLSLSLDLEFIHRQTTLHEGSGRLTMFKGQGWGKKGHQMCALTQKVTIHYKFTVRASFFFPLEGHPVRHFNMFCPQKGQPRGHFITFFPLVGQPRQNFIRSLHWKGTLEGTFAVFFF